MKRILIVCPGRGSYTREQLGSLKPTPSVAAADAFRAALGRPTPTALDQAPNYSSALHVAGENASILTMACTLADVDVLRDVEVVAVVGNSMGWYTALGVAGALSLPDAFTLVETMGQYQAGNVIGGQIVYPLHDADWRALPSPELEQLLIDQPGLYWSIRLGGQAVLGGTPEAIAAALARLPPRKIGTRDAPFQLPLHSAFHTPLMAATSARARHELRGLRFSAPRVPLIDGRGRIFRPRFADPAELADYTLGAQVVEPYDFTTSLRVALREYAPDHIVLPGPGDNLGGAIAQVLLAEGWLPTGWPTLQDRGQFIANQATAPFVVSMCRPPQRALVT